MRFTVCMVLLAAMAGQLKDVVAQDAAAPVTAPETELKSTIDRASYAIGMSIGNNLKRQKLDILNPSIIIEGIKDSFAGAEPKMNQADLQAAFAELEKLLEERAKLIGQTNLETGRKFLADNAKKQGVVTTKSGLQYTILKTGDGQRPKATDEVVTHYKGTLLSGEVFDGTFKGDAPAAEDETISFPVNGVIAGWTEALQLMNVGSHWRLYIPSDLAYGERGAGGSIGPNQVLVFDLHLISVK